MHILLSDRSGHTEYDTQRLRRLILHTRAVRVYAQDHNQPTVRDPGASLKLSSQLLELTGVPLFYSAS